jgi:RNA polymerase sporulation-specific sigma factor
VYNDGSDTILVMDQIKDKNNTDERWIENVSLNDAIARLDERERDILTKRYFEGKTQMEVSEEVGISQAQVSRLEKNAVGRIRSFL